MRTIIASHEPAKLPVRRGAAKPLDPPMFVRWHRLRSQLAADPFELLGDDHASTGLGQRERRRASAQSTTNNRDFRGKRIHDEVERLDHADRRSVASLLAAWIAT